MEQASGAPGGRQDPPPGIEYVGFWIRFLAFLVDSVLATVIITPVIYAVAGALGYAGAPTPAGYVVSLVQLVLVAAAFIVFWVYRSATPGKMIFHARIADAATFGALSTGQAVIRYIGYYISSLPLFLGFLWIGWDRRKQGWHDKIAGTVVIRDVPLAAPPEAPLASPPPEPGPTREGPG